MSEELVTMDTVKARVPAAIQQAQALIIKTPDDYASAAAVTKTIKGAIKIVNAFFDPMIASALATHRAALAQKATFVNPLKAAEEITKKKLEAYDAEQERIRLAEQQRLQREADERARKERERAEAAARLQREKEAAAQREADEARRKAAEASNAKERERLQKEAEARQKEATAAAAKAQAKEEKAATVSAPVIQVASTTPEVKGLSYREIWRARVVDAAKVPREYLVPNMDALNGIAKATKGTITIPGVEMYSERSASSTSK